MKAIVWILVFVSLGCRNRHDVSIEPNLPIGTWKASAATAQLPNRWTFDSNWLYMKTDTLSHCKPAESQPWQYRTEKNILITRYNGITNGMFPTPEERLAIVSLTSERLIISADNKIQEFERCN
jgi:hypothetical protein